MDNIKEELVDVKEEKEDVMVVDGVLPGSENQDSHTNDFEQIFISGGTDITQIKEEGSDEYNALAENDDELDLLLVKLEESENVTEIKCDEELDHVEESSDLLPTQVTSTTNKTKTNSMTQVLKRKRVNPAVEEQEESHHQGKKRGRPKKHTHSLGAKVGSLSGHQGHRKKSKEGYPPRASYVEKLSWTRGSECLLLDLVRQRRYLWDPRHPQFSKTKLRKEAFNFIAETVKEEYPELIRLDGGMARLKFKSIKTYFLQVYKKIRDAPSGSKGSPGSKWPLFDSASFLMDTLLNDSPHEATLNLPSTENSTSDKKIVASITFEAHAEAGVIIQDATCVEPTSCEFSQSQLPSEPPSVPISQSSSSCAKQLDFMPSSPSLKLEATETPNPMWMKTPVLNKKRKRDRDTSQDWIDDQLKGLDQFMSKRSHLGHLDISIGEVVASASSHLPVSAKFKLLGDICELVTKYLPEEKN